MGNVTAGYRDLHVHKDTNIALVFIYTHTYTHLTYSATHSPEAEMTLISQ